MELHITWEAVLAVIAIIAFFSGVIALYVKLQFREFADQLIDKLDERYVQQAQCARVEAELKADLKELARGYAPESD